MHTDRKRSIDDGFVGTWVTADEDSDVAIKVEAENGEILVSGFCRSDGEPLDVCGLSVDARVLDFTTRVASSGYEAHMSMRLRGDGCVDVALTTSEVWKKVDAVPGKRPPGWSKH